MTVGMLPDVPAIVPRPPGEMDLPLSWGQQRMWFLHELDPSDTAYHVFAARRLRGPLAVDRLVRALSDLVARHESLRTRFPAVDGVPVQVVGPAEPVTLSMSPLGGEDPEKQARDLLVQWIETPFDLAEGPLLRFVLLRLGDGEHLLCLVVHHIVVDGWSLGLMCAELSALYRAAATPGRKAPLPPLPVQYADYALWQRRAVVEDASTDYWLDRLTGVPPLDLRGSRPRPAVRTSRGATLRRRLPAALRAEVSRFARARRVTLFMTVLAAYQAVLARHSGLDDVCVGTPVSVRDEVELEPLIGLFVNTLALRGDLSGDPTFEELIARTRATALEAYAHADVPFDRLVAELRLPRDLRRTPVFQVMFRLDADAVAELELDGLAVTPFELDHRSAQVDLALEVTWGEDVAWAEFVYNADLLKPVTVEGMARDLEELLAVGCGVPETRLSAFGVTPTSRRELPCVHGLPVIA
jgi:Condensation domain